MKRTTDGPDLEQIPGFPLSTQLDWQEIVWHETEPDARRMLNWWLAPAGPAPSDEDETMADTFRRMWGTDEGAGNGRQS